MGELLDKAFGPVVAKARSDRDAGVLYDIRRRPHDGALSCSCASFEYRKTYKHLDRYRAQLAQNVQVAP